MISPRARDWLLACAFLLATAAAYAPGLGGDFQFDDASNLETLGDFGPIDDTLSLLYYATSGTADPTGRPISTLSFLLDADDWPDNPQGFRTTNLLLHLLNAVLLMLAIGRLEVAVRSRQGTHLNSGPSTVAVLAGALWVAHPLLVSTTLYIVQRHAMLPLTFGLLGMLALDAGVRRIQRGDGWAGATWALAGSGIATLLAGLSKPNGFLLPLLLLATLSIAYAAPRNGPGSLLAFRIVRAGLAIPSAAILLALAWLFAGAVGAGDQLPRPWSMLDRTLSQPRAIVVYLSGLVAPREGTAGLYADDFVVSTGVFEPWTTLPAILAVAALVVLAWRSRARCPRVSLALGFYLIAHLMESFAIALEPFFEHRNYLPSALLFWPLAAWITNGRAMPRARIAMAVALPLLLLLLTLQRAMLWGKPEELAAVWAARNAGSLRSQLMAAHQEFAAGSPSAAIDRLEEALEQFPHSIEAAATLIGFECTDGHVPASAVDYVERAFAESPAWHQGIFDWTRRAVMAYGKNQCQGFGAPELTRLIAAARSNHQIALTETRRQRLTFLQGLLALEAENGQAALDQFDAAIGFGFDHQQGLMQVASLGEYGHPRLALQHLHTLQMLPAATQGAAPRSMQGFHRHLLQETRFFEREYSHLEHLLQRELETTQLSPGTETEEDL